MADRGAVRSVHDEVDALDDGAWWEGRVTQVRKQGIIKVQPFISSSLLTVKQENVRAGLAWDGLHGWSLRSTTGAAAASTFHHTPDIICLTEGVMRLAVCQCYHYTCEAPSTFAAAIDQACFNSGMLLFCTVCCTCCLLAVTCCMMRLLPAFCAVQNDTAGQ